MSKQNQKFEKKETIFNSQKELQQYFVDSLKSCKKLNFNLKALILT